MKLSSITVENFRCFEKLTLDLHPELTVLIAPNGAGKTTMLDAARIAVWPFVKAFDLGGQVGKSATIQTEDVRMVPHPKSIMEPVIPSKVIATGIWCDNGSEKKWVQTRKKVKRGTNTLYNSDSRKLIKFGETLQKQVRDFERERPVDLPLMAYFGSGRLWYQGRHTSIAKDKMLDQGTYSRTWGYRNCISATSNYKQFEEWYAWVYRSYWEERINHDEKGKPLGESGQSFLDTITVVKNAVNEIVEKETGWKDIAYSSSLQQQLVLSHPEQGKIPLSMLSDGLRNSIVTAADIAFRCIKLNPHFGIEAAQKTTGIVMIDEVDMFLHPAWQQTIIPSFRRAFPKIQFIMTTHSPQVLSTVKSECIRILKDGNVYKAPKGTKGAEASRILKRVQDVDVRPRADENTRLLQSYLDLVYQDQWQSPEALEMREQLNEIFENEEPALTEADFYIENRQWELDIETDQ